MINQNTSHDLFFEPTKVSDFPSVLEAVQKYISQNYASLLLEKDKGEVKTQIMFQIQKYLSDNRLKVYGMDENELADKLYTEMAEYSFLTKYIFGKGIEEININAWNDIEVYYSGGRKEKLDEHFESPQHAVNVVRRMLHASGMVLDNAAPAVLGSLTKNIRIAVLKSPLVDDDAGVSASIRIVNPMNFSKQDLIDCKTATEPMLDFLSQLIRYGVSVCVAGATGSGKTTVAGWMLSTYPDDKRVFTIESGSREVSLVKTENGKVVNSIVHTQTRPSENEAQNISQVKLLDIALRFNPNLIFVGEIRDAEAYVAQEASRTGVPVLTTIHSNSCEATYLRMVTLCKRMFDAADKTLYDLVTEAFPIIVYAKQLENGERKIMEIMECEIKTDGERVYRTIYRYNIRENYYDETGRLIIKGEHEFIGEISDGLKKRLVENGLPKSELEKICRGEAAVC